MNNKYFKVGFEKRAFKKTAWLGTALNIASKVKTGLDIGSAANKSVKAMKDMPQVPSNFWKGGA